jgi:hypothetical protein
MQPQSAQTVVLVPVVLSHVTSPVACREVVDSQGVCLMALGCCMACYPLVVAYAVHMVLASISDAWAVHMVVVTPPTW